jgi:hypothetical protein
MPELPSHLHDLYLAAEARHRDNSQGRAALNLVAELPGHRLATGAYPAIRVAYAASELRRVSKQAWAAHGFRQAAVKLAAVVAKLPTETQKKAEKS